MKKNLLQKVAIIAMSAIALNANAQVCTAGFTYTVGASGSVNFTNTSTGLGSNPNYTWSFGDNTNSNVASPGHTYGYNGGYWVTLTIDSANGFSTCSFTDSLVISNALTCNLNAAFTYTANSGGVVDFTDASTGVDPGMNYTWHWYGPSGQGYSGQSSPSFTFTYNGTYTVSMSVADANQMCYQTTTQLVTVTNALPCQVSYTYAQGAAGLVNFTNTSQGPTGYAWDFGDGSYSTQSSPAHTYMYNGVYYITLTADTNGGSCGGSMWDSVIITNTQNAPSCTASFTYSLGSNGQVNFTNTSSGTVTNPTYGWSFGNGTASSTFSPSYTYAYNGSYYVQLSEMDSVGNTICSTWQTINITNASSCGDSAYFIMYPDTNAMSVWYVDFYTASGATPQSVVWSWGDGTSSTGVNPVHTYTTAGWYNVCVMAFYACGDSSFYCQNDSVYRSSGSMISVYVINNTTGVQQVSELRSLIAYPNPFSDELTVSLASTENRDVTFTMFDMMGNVVASQKIPVTKGENVLRLKTGDLGNGVYFVRVSDANGNATTLKVVK